MGIKQYEKDITKKGLKLLKTLIPGFYKKRAATMNNRGEPDITGCYQGYRVEIEVKLPGNYPTELQAKNLTKWATAGAIAGVAVCEEDFENIMTPYIIKAITPKNRLYVPDSMYLKNFTKEQLAKLSIVRAGN